MATRRRVLYPSAIYHVTARVLDGLEPFDSDAARELCLVEIDKAIRGHGLECHAYCVMSNHFHLLLRTPEGDLPEAMQQLNSNIARGFNRRHGRRGPVFEAPYGAVLIERQEHLLEVARYVVLNPVRARICADPADWPWSSYRATAGLERPLRFLTTDWLLSQLGGPSGYRRFVAEGAPATLERLLLAA